MALKTKCSKPEAIARVDQLLRSLEVVPRRPSGPERGYRFGDLTRVVATKAGGLGGSVPAVKLPPLPPAPETRLRGYLEYGCIAYGYSVWLHRIHFGLHRAHIWLHKVCIWPHKDRIWLGRRTY